MRYNVLIVLLLCVHVRLSAQALILGQLADDQIGFVRLHLDHRYLDGTETTQTALLTAEGKFGLAADIRHPQLVQLEYNQRRVELFLEPGDTLRLQGFAVEFPARLRFEGNAAADNETWQLYRQKFPYDGELFRHRQYRRGPFYYPIHQDEDERMQKNAPADYLPTIAREWQARLDFAKQSQGLSKNFAAFIRADIDFQYFYLALAYAHVYKNRWQVDAQALFAPVDSLVYWSDTVLADAHYRRFALAYTYFKSEKINPDDPYPAWYIQAQKSMPRQSLSQLATQAAIVAQGFRRESPQRILSIYQDFLEQNPYLELDNIVAQAASATQQLLPNTAAPTFSLPDSNGHQTALRDFVGRYVYIDFWASWCRPCLQKLQDMPAIEADFAAQNIVFLHINLDKDPDDWRAALRRLPPLAHQLHHPYAGGVDAAYQVFSLPKYFIINPQGNFVFAPPAQDAAQLREHISRALQQK